MLTGKQRAYLRRLGNELLPIFQIGKSGLSEEQLYQLDAAIEARELIKVRVLTNQQGQLGDLAEEMAAGLGAQIVQKIGRTFLLYRRSLETPRLELP